MLCGRRYLTLFLHFFALTSTNFFALCLATDGIWRLIGQLYSSFLFCLFFLFCIFFVFTLSNFFALFAATDGIWRLIGQLYPSFLLCVFFLFLHFLCVHTKQLFWALYGDRRHLAADWSTLPKFPSHTKQLFPFLSDTFSMLLL